MGHDETGCFQAGEIGAIKATLQFFQDAEKRRESREERIAVAMETIAAQGETLKSHGETLIRHDKALGEVFGRMRKIENPPILTRILNTRTGRYIFAGLVGGCLVGITRNPEAFGKIVKLIIG